TERDDELRMLAGALVGDDGNDRFALQRVSLGLRHQDRAPGSGEPVGEQPGGRHRRPAPGVDDEQHRPVGRGHAGPAATARCTSSSVSADAPTCSQRKYSTLPAGPGNGLATTATAPSPRTRAASRTALIDAARDAGSRTTPPAPTSSRPTSNCGL